MKNLENNHLRLLESTKTDTVSKAVETIKEIKKDKSIRQQEVNRKIREIRHANAKIVSEKQQVLMQKHDKDLKNIKERLKEISSLFEDELDKEIENLQKAWMQLPFGDTITK